MKNKLIFGGLFFALIALFNFDASAQRRASTYRGGVNRGRVIMHNAPMARMRGYSNYGWSRPRVGLSLQFGLPGLGIGISSLPYGYRRIMVSGMPFFYFNSNFYRSTDDGRYEQVEAPLGATVDALPAGSKKVKIDGEVYYEYRGTYYLPDVDNNGNRVYVVVGVNGELNTNEAFNNQDETTYNNNSNSDYNNQNNYNVPKANSSSIKVKVGDRLDELPRNAKVVTRNGEMLYESENGVLYKKIVSEDTIVYEVVKIP